MKFPADNVTSTQDPGKELWGKLSQMITGTEHEEEFLKDMCWKIKAHYTKEEQKEELIRTLNSKKEPIKSMD